MFHDGDQRPVVWAATTSPNLAVDQVLPKWSNGHAGPFVSLLSHLHNGNDDDSNVHTHIPRMNNGTAYCINKGMKATWHTVTSMVRQRWQYRLHNRHADQKCNIQRQEVRGVQGRRIGTGTEEQGNTFVHIYVLITSHMWPTTGPLPISIGNNLILDLAYLIRPKPLPKLKFGSAFGRTWKSNNFLTTHSDHLSDYFQA